MLPLYLPPLQAIRQGSSSHFWNNRAFIGLFGRENSLNIGNKGEDQGAPSVSVCPGAGVSPVL